MLFFPADAPTHIGLPSDPKTWKPLVRVGTPIGTAVSAVSDPNNTPSLAILLPNVSLGYINRALNGGEQKMVAKMYSKFVDLCTEMSTRPQVINPTAISRFLRSQVDEFPNSKAFAGIMYVLDQVHDGWGDPKKNISTHSVSFLF